jgi:hypothetical protein
MNTMGRRARRRPVVQAISRFGVAPEPRGCREGVGFDPTLPLVERFLRHLMTFSGLLGSGSRSSGRADDHGSSPSSFGDLPTVASSSS